MNLQNFKKLKDNFNKRYLQLHKEEIMENKKLLDKILNDFVLVTKQKENISSDNENGGNKTNQGETLEVLEKQKEQALENLDIIKIKEINNKIKNLTDK